MIEEILMHSARARPEAIETYCELGRDRVLGAKFTNQKSKVEDAILDLLSPSLVPVLGTDVTAGSSGDVHFCLIAVFAVGAFPDELAVLVGYLDLTVKAAYLTVVALGVELCVHYVIVDELHYSENCIEVVLHIGNLNVGDSTARRESLELSLELQLRERVYLLGNVYVVGVGDVVSVAYTGNYAEAVLKRFRELISSALERRAVERIVDILGSLPLCGILIELLHNGKSEFLALGLGELLSVKRVYTLPKTREAKRNGRISTVQILVYRLTLWDSGERTVLPKDGGRVGESAGKSLVTALKCSVAKLHTLVKDLPELIHTAAGRKTDVGKVNCYDALIESAVILGRCR